jgi:hypothetical protein
VQQYGGLGDTVTILGFIGIGFVLVAYLLNLVTTAPRWADSALYKTARALIGGWKYPTANLIGSLLIMVSLWKDWNAPSFVVELCWAVISVLGLGYSLVASHEGDGR